MNFYMATKLALKTLFDEKFRKAIIIAISVAIVIFIGITSVATLPILVLNLPHSAFQPKEEADKTNQKYIKILADYKQKIDSEVNSIVTSRNSNDSSDDDITSISVNYPTLAEIIAYENVVNKERYLKEKNIEPDKGKIFTFLNSCVQINISGSTLTVIVKTVDGMASTFKSEEEKNMFLSIHDAVKKTDLDNATPSTNIPNDLQYLEGGISLPYLNQGDGRWGDLPYGSSTIRKSACGVVSMCMVINGLIPNTNIMPPELANWSANNGYYIAGAGTAWSIFDGLASKYNLRMKNMSRNNPQEILNELKQGHPVVVSMSPGHFTKGGHFITLRGVTADGKILVNDPGSYERSQMSWDFSIILSESSNLSDSCFWSFSK